MRHSGRTSTTPTRHSEPPQDKCPGQVGLTVPWDIGRTTPPLLGGCPASSARLAHSGENHQRWWVTRFDRIWPSRHRSSERSTMAALGPGRSGRNPASLATTGWGNPPPRYPGGPADLPAPDIFDRKGPPAQQQAHLAEVELVERRFPILQFRKRPRWSVGLGSGATTGLLVTAAWPRRRRHGPTLRRRCLFAPDVPLPCEGRAGPRASASTPDQSEAKVASWRDRAGFFPVLSQVIGLRGRSRSGGGVLWVRWRGSWGKAFRTD